MRNADVAGVQDSNRVLRRDQLEGRLASPVVRSIPELAAVELEVLRKREAKIVLSHSAHIAGQRLHLFFVDDGRDNVEIGLAPAGAGLVDVDESTIALPPTVTNLGELRSNPLSQTYDCPLAC